MSRAYTFFFLSIYWCHFANAQNTFDPDAVVDIEFSIGDPSGSHSERWQMDVAGAPEEIVIASPDFGEMGSETHTWFRKGNSYDITIQHVATHPDYTASTQDPERELLYRGTSWYGSPSPDYDYRAEVDILTDDVLYWIEDDQGEGERPLIGSSNGSDTNEAAGKTATLHLYKVYPTEIEFMAGSSGSNYHELVSDDGNTTYSGPHWLDDNGDGDPNQNYPVAFTRNTLPQISAEFEYEGDSLVDKNVEVRATGPGQVAIPVTSVDTTSNTLTLNATESSGAFANTVEFYDAETAGQEFEITWEARIEGGEWAVVGISQHSLYVTLTDPVTSLRQHTLFYLSCKNAAGISNQSEITDAIWSEFTDLVVTRVDGHQLTYYNQYTCSVTSTEGLLEFGDGQCGSWAKFFIDLRKIHGIDDSNEYIIFEPIVDDGFAVKNWTFSGSGTSGHPTHPYLNIPENSLIGSSSYNWKYAEANDATGIPGQGNDNPASLFNNHQVVISGEYYDPSYGQKHSSLQEIDDNAVEGFYIAGTYPVDEPSVNLDLNGDGDKNDLAVTTYVMLFRENPAGLDLKETPYNY